MFDVGFWEMVLVGVVALLVFGPERLPRVARETALWLRKARSMVASVKHDIDQELQLYELQESMKKQKQALSSTIRLDVPGSAPGKPAEVEGEVMAGVAEDIEHRRES